MAGGAGYIGSYAVLALRDANWPVVVLDNLVIGFHSAVPEDVAFEQGDVTDQPFVEDVLTRHGVKAIMQFAGSVVVPESGFDPLKYHRNNIAASRAPIESAVEVGVPHFIFSSTAPAYGTLKDSASMSPKL